MKLRTLTSKQDDNSNKSTFDSRKGDIKWILLESHLLDKEHILLLYNKKYLQEARKQHPGTVIYFPPEVEELYKSQRLQPCRESLKIIHRYKKEFGSWIVPSIPRSK